MSADTAIAERLSQSQGLSADRPPGEAESPLREDAAGTETHTELPLTVIRPPRGWAAPNLREVWQYRDLLMLLIRRDIVGRYRQSVVGYAWAVIKPVLSMLIFTFIFSRVAKIPSDGSPYPLFAFTALLPWMYFSGALTSSTASVVTSGALLKKVYFPRLILPLSSVVGGLIELSIQLVVLGGLMWWYGFVPTWRIVLAPGLVLLALLTALSAGLWLTALNVKYRDVSQAVPFVTQAWMWLSPIVYSSNAVPPELRPVYGLNPMVGVIEGFRWSILGTTTPDWNMMGVSAAVVAAMLLGGLMYFRRTETTFADVV